MRVTAKKYGDFADIAFTSWHVYDPNVRRKSSSDRQKYMSSISRAVSQVRYIGLSNKWDYFCTFTLDPKKVRDRTDYKRVFARMSQVLRDIRKTSDYDLQYLVIPELHRDYESYHFHALLSGVDPKLVSKNEYGYDVFVPFQMRFGYTSMSPVRANNAVTFYCLKYICKSFETWSKYPGAHLYFCSHGLKRPERFADLPAVPRFRSFDGDIVFQETEEGSLYAHLLPVRVAEQYIDRLQNPSEDLPEIDMSFEDNKFKLSEVKFNDDFEHVLEDFRLF